MEVYDEILSLNDKDALKKWFQLSSDCKQTQHDVLMGILDNAKDS